MRLIDADKLFEEVGRIKPRNKEHYESIGEFMIMITNSETIASVPKHGEWLEAREEDPCWYRCSECGRLYDLDENYCPNCGARMEVEE